ncbi:putative toxin-antitoxin system toxin component, PIN family [Propionivibrio sp.]|uniref:putative toxin-antitoxin system toxin component, PIN family n=1 Tax=Propionivibrio sp. TaxID=2212460 RepID=UPI003BEFA06D
MGPRSSPVVIDTNVWVSGLLTKSGHPARLTRQVVRNGQPIFSDDTFAELRERLWRPKFDRYVTLEQRNDFLRDLASVAIWVDVPPSVAEKTFCRDATDDKFIHAALVAGAAWLVTGDQDLLVLSESVSSLHGVKILSPADASGLPEFSGFPPERE